ncbi:porin [Massilia niastensis]|uniref:porin n=1 Tax=Massilia niastensis TaxID=544911 RepID=UPI0003A0F77B|nr:porin [Massilia niastensis]
MTLPTHQLFAMALAGLGSLASIGAQAQNVEIYGVIGAYVGSVKRSGEGEGVRSVNSGGLQTSYLGFRGKEDLGGGIKAIFSLESFFRADTGEQGRSSADPLFSRNAWVGLEGGLGRLTLGRQTNPTYIAAGQLSPFGISVMFAPLTLHSFVAAYGSNIVGDTVWNNTIQYASPEIAGFKGALIYGAGEVAGQEGLANLGLHATYRRGKLYAALSAQRVRVNVSTPLPVQQEAVLAGAAYDFGKFKVFGSTSHTRIEGGRRNRLVDAGLSVQLSAAGSFLMEVARSNIEMPGVPETHRTTASVGYDHRLSKRTDLYLVHTHDKRSNTGSAGTTALAIRHLF